MGETYMFIGDGVSQKASEASWTAMHPVRRIDRIRINRIPFYGMNGAWREIEPGHYWFEIGHDDHKINESYGWYPTEAIANAPVTRQVTSLLALPASEGCINGDSPERQAWQRAHPGPVLAGGGIGTKPFPWDPHQIAGGALSVRHPYINVGDDRSDEQIVQELRDYAAKYKNSSDGKWSFKFDDPSENNCHTFVWQALFHCGLVDIDILDAEVDPHFASIANGGVHMTGVSKIVGYLNRPDFVEYLSSRTKMIRGILEKYS